jgi:hypothetical protein
LGSDLGFDCFSLPDMVWYMSFPPHAQHSSMMKTHSCACGSMLNKNKNPQDAIIVLAVAVAVLLVVLAVLARKVKRYANSN